MKILKNSNQKLKTNSFKNYNKKKKIKQNLKECSLNKSFRDNYL